VVLGVLVLVCGVVFGGGGWGGGGVGWGGEAGGWGPRVGITTVVVRGASPHWETRGVWGAQPSPVQDRIIMVGGGGGWGVCGGGFGLVHEWGGVLSGLVCNINKPHYHRPFLGCRWGSPLGVCGGLNLAWGGVVVGGVGTQCCGYTVRG